MVTTQIFAGNPLDRGDRQRRDEGWITKAAESPRSKFLPVAGQRILVSTGNINSLGWLSHEQIRQMKSDSIPIFLGEADATAYFTVDMSALDLDTTAVPSGGGYSFHEARGAAEFVSREEAGIIAQALSQTNWHKSHRFCSSCGSPTAMRRGGQVRECANCSAQHFPRTDPVVIMVVSAQDYCLLGQSRGRMSQANMYSALAGFMDQGETIEEAVSREVMEEAGINIGNIRYFSSQPWPFPHSLMIGCHADAVTTEINKDEEEMAEVKWFHRNEVRLALEGSSNVLQVPGPLAIAHHLIKAWANKDPGNAVNRQGAH